MADTFLLHSPAKLNLRLKITGRRDDGYHLLSMLNASVSLSDRISLELRDAAGIELSVEGDLPSSELESLRDSERNIAARAARGFFDAFKVGGGIAIRIHKSIPVGAGMGGGSGNAAAVIRFLAASHSGTLAARPDSSRVLAQLALGLGADVPYALVGGPAIVGGVGELVSPLSLGMLPLGPVALILPPFPVSTAAVFAAARKEGASFEQDEALKRFAAGQRSEIGCTEAELLALIDNDLERYAIRVEPRVARMRAAIQAVGAGTVGFSGSGSTFFVLLPPGLPDDNCMREQELRVALGESGARVLAAEFLSENPAIERCGC